MPLPNSRRVSHGFWWFLLLLLLMDLQFLAKSKLFCVNFCLFGNVSLHFYLFRLVLNNFLRYFILFLLMLLLFELLVYPSLRCFFLLLYLHGYIPPICVFLTALEHHLPVTHTLSYTLFYPFSVILVLHHLFIMMSRTPTSEAYPLAQQLKLIIVHILCLTLILFIILTVIQRISVKVHFFFSFITRGLSILLSNKSFLCMLLSIKCILSVLLLDLL